MRAIYYNGSEAQYCDDYPQPTPAAGEVLIRVTLGAICNTDREVMRGYSPDFTGVMGHEFTGIVEEVADPSSAHLIGQRVVGEINLSCFQPDCLYCSSGRSSQCEGRSALGIAGKDGCFADYLTLPMRLLHVIPDSLPDETAIFTEPLAAALRITEQAHISPDEPIALVGDGRLAYMIGQVIALTGAPLTVYGMDEKKLEMFSPFAQTRLVKDRSASTQVISPQGDSYEVVIDATGSPDSLASSIALTRSGGLLLMKSTYADNAEINMSEVVVRELTIKGSRCGPFAPALRYLERGLITLPPVELFVPQEFEEAFASPVFKVALKFH
jgi:threonine dehydrogenase-like Zn-dependent dehydrogenase